jgi:hypothetical protein
MNDPLPEKPILEHIRELRKKRNEILGLPPEQALEKILSDPQPAALVHSFAESDFYLLVHEIGPEDSMPLLALASDKQWNHIVDLESWAKDRIEVTGVTRWLNLLLEADPSRFIRWFLKDRLNFIEFYLFHNIEVRVREHDQDPSELGEGFFTLDQVYYVRFLKLPAALLDSAIGEEERRQFLMRFLERLAAHDHLVFQHVLLEATHVIPAETEEEEYHWRNVRLTEKGFVPFDEAIGIYQPVKLLELKSLTSKFLPRAPEAVSSMLPVPAYPLREMPRDSFFSQALERIEPDNTLADIQWEFANLCNQIIVADHKSIRQREQLRQIVAKACGYISIGLERIEGKQHTERDPGKAAAALIRFPLLQLFRLGFAAGLDLKWQAERWLSQCWFAKSGLRLTFWGEQWMGAIGGILLKKPLYYDNYQTGVLYREFTSLEDVAHIEKIFRQVQALDRLLSVMNIRLNTPARYGFLTWKNLILTLWAGQRLARKEATLTPLPLKAFTRFYVDLLPGAPEPDSTQPRRVPDSMKADFIAWLARNTGWKDREITDRLGQVFEELFCEIEAEYGRVNAKDLDPRFVQLFLLSAA